MQRPINHCSSLQWYHSLKRSKPRLLCFAIFVVYLAKYFPQLPQKLLQKSKCGCINAWYIDFNVVCGKRCLARFTAPIPEATFFYEFLDMSTPIESIINNGSQRFSVSNLLDLSTVDRKCRGNCETTLPLSRSNENELCFSHS